MNRKKVHKHFDRATIRQLRLQSPSMGVGMILCNTSGRSSVSWENVTCKKCLALRPTLRYDLRRCRTDDRRWKQIWDKFNRWFDRQGSFGAEWEEQESTINSLITDVYLLGADHDLDWAGVWLAFGEWHDSQEWPSQQRKIRQLFQREFDLKIRAAGYPNWGDQSMEYQKGIIMWQIDVEGWIFDPNGDKFNHRAYTGQKLESPLAGDGPLRVVGGYGHTIYAIGEHGEVYERRVADETFRRSETEWARSVGFPHDWHNSLQVIRWACDQALALESAFAEN